MNCSQNQPYDWSVELVPVQGFGFLPNCVSEEMEKRFQQILVMLSIDTRNMTYAVLDRMKCDIIVKEYWRSFYPQFENTTRKGICPPLWDNASCIPPTAGGDTAVIPCMRMYAGQYYAADKNASRKCLHNGTWDSITDYEECSLQFLDVSNYVSLVIYAVGYVLSFLALFLALSIFLSFRELRCLRHKIHVGIFFSFGLSAFSWIITNSLMELSHQLPDVFIHITCIFWVLTSYFHLTNFYWMFLEGFYLFLQVQFPLSLTSIKHKHFLIFGWGFPLVNMLVWVGLRLVYHNNNNNMNIPMNICPFFESSALDYVHTAPSFIILCCNTFFLIWIMLIVISKLRQQTALDHDRRHLKAAKALLFVMPLLGICYLITLVPPSRENSKTAYNVFTIGRSLLLSTQGLMISITYCFVNDEVQTVLRTHWRRERMVRRVGRETRSPLKASMQTSYCDQTLFMSV